MNRKNVVRSWYVGPALLVAGLTLLVAVTMTGCAGQAVSTLAGVGSGKADADTVIDTSYPDSLDVSGQLALGTLRLEGTGQAVTPEQAATLLPLWQAIRGGTLQGEAEIGAVLSQIEGEMAAEQLETIAGMQLTPGDLQSWAQEQGLGFGAGDGSGPMGGGEDLSEEGWAARMAELGITDGDLPAGMGELTEEEREALRATVEAGDMPAGGSVGASSGQLTIVVNPLVELLTQRAAE